ncbi:MAG: lamin tail domain-containing protein [Candidatus Altiarchaeota archaeon]
MELTNKRLMSTVFTVAIVVLLYLSGPSSAITVALNSISNIYAGQRASISANVSINDYEFIMTTGAVNLTLSNSSGLITYCALPINGTNTNLAVTCSDNQTATVSSSTTSAFAYGYGYGYTSGYGYAPVQGYQSTYAYTYGYGYNNSGVWAATNLAYTISMPIPVSYGAGTFTANVSVMAGSTTVSTSGQTFTVTAQTSLPSRGVAGARIDEVYLNPSGNDTAALTCNGEWVEIYNNGTSTANLTGWIVSNAEGQNITIGSTTVASDSSVAATAGGYTVVCYNASMAYLDWLDNSEDSVLLYNSSGTLWDIISYSASTFAGTPLVTTNESAAVAAPPLFSVQASGYWFVQNVSVILAANGTVSATNTSSRGTVNPGWTNTQTITMAQGWNLISLPVTPSNTSINESLTSVYGNYILVYGYNASVSPGWISYNPYALSPGANSLNFTSNTQGYWIKVNETTNSTNLTNTGTLATSTAIGLVSGWNLIGYPTLATATVNATLNSIAGQYILVYGYNVSASPAWVSYNPYALSPGANSLNYSTPGYGYWIKVNATTATLTVTGSTS